MSQACFVDRVLLDKIMRMDPECGGPFGRVFAQYAEQQLPWHQLPWVYLKAQAARHRAMVDLHESVQHVLWVDEIRHGHQHWVWFAILCHDATVLENTVTAYERVRGRGIAYLRRVWDQLQQPEMERLPDGSYVPPCHEQPTPQLRAEFGTRQAGRAAPITSLTQYERQMRQIRPDDTRLRSETTLAVGLPNVVSFPAVVYSWDRAASEGDGEKSHHDATVGPDVCA